jgi:hypothetical protein
VTPVSYPDTPASFISFVSASALPSLKSKKTYLPNNAPHLAENPHFIAIVHSELSAGRWLGPVSIKTAEQVLGPIQSSPCSMVPKPRNPDAMRLIENFSAPRIPVNGISSINSGMDIAEYGTTWGTPAAMCLMVWSLPPGSQIAIRDITAAYRSAMLDPSQWPGTVVRLTDDTVAVDLCAAFGMVTSGGIFGHIADAACDIFRHAGIGPILKWVDDFVFARVLLRHLAEVNRRRAELHEYLRRRRGTRPGKLISASARRGCLTFWGKSYDDRSVDEYVEDFAFPLRDLSAGSVRSAEDMLYNCSIDDINRISAALGLQWALPKDHAYASANPYHGMRWDVDARTVSLDEDTRARYLESVIEWLSKRQHDLAEAQKLSGRLQYVSFLLPSGRPYLAELYKFIRLYDARTADAAGHDPHKPLSASGLCREELEWWRTELGKPISRGIPRPVEVVDIR